MPAAAAFIATVLAPTAAANLQWAALFAAASAVVVAGVVSGSRAGLVRWLLLLVFAAGIFAFLVPVLKSAAGCRSGSARR